MRFFSSELGQDYATYTFSYCNYGVLEEGDKLAAMYERGYLPFSGSPSSRGMFYMARGGRINLAEFELNSECRRVAKKFDGQFSRKRIPLSDFEITDDCIEFWLSYFKRAHGPTVMPKERLMHILTFGIISHVVVYKNTGGEIVGYVFEVSDQTMSHDWYQSYSEVLDKSSFGMWLLIDMARVAKERGAQHYYPGTVYGNATDYKTNLPALEFWNGESWIKDPNNKALRLRTGSDAERQITSVDEWKENHPLF